MGLWDLTTDYIYFAPRYQAMLGYADSEFANSLAEKLSHIHPDDREHESEIIRQYLAREIPEYNDTLRLLNKNGIWRCGIRQALLTV